MRNEVHNLRHMMTLALLQQPSVSERLRAVNWIQDIERMDKQVVSALIRTLNSDPNVNVRIAAVSALQTFSQDAKVQTSLLESFKHQTSPLVQIELIHWMVMLNEKNSAPILQEFIAKDEINPTVRQRAADWTSLAPR